MDNDPVFEIDARLDTAVQSRTNGKQKVTAGHDDMVAAKGGIHSTMSGIRSTERDPLIAGGSDDEGQEEQAPDFDTWKTYPWYKRPSVVWLLPTFFLLATAFGGTIVPKLNLMLNLICRQYLAEKSIQDPSLVTYPIILGEDNDQCRNADVQALVARFTLYGNLLSGGLSAITSPRLGALSDRYGRTILVAIVSFGMMASEVITILVAKHPDTISVNWFLLGFAVDGLFGSFTGSMALIHSYASDCTKPADRGAAFSYFHACLFSGIALGPLFASFVISWTGSILSVFYIALTFHTTFILFMAFVVPESLTKERQLLAREKYRIGQQRYGPAADWINYLRTLNVFGPLDILYPRGPGTSPALRRNLLLLAGIDTVMFGIAMSMLTVVVIYLNYAFGWGSVESNRYVSIINIARVFCLLVLLPAITKLVRSRIDTKRPGADILDLTCVRLGILFDTLGYIGFAFAPSGFAFTIAGVIASVGGIASPTVQAALTKHMPPDRVGQLLGATGLLHALARIGGPLVFNGLYSLTVKSYAPAIFVVLAGVFGTTFLASWFVKPHITFEEDKPSSLFTDERYTDDIPAAPLERSANGLPA